MTSIYCRYIGRFCFAFCIGILIQQFSISKQENEIQPEVKRLNFFSIMTDQLFDGNRFKMGTYVVSYQVLYFMSS